MNGRVRVSQVDRWWTETAITASVRLVIAFNSQLVLPGGRNILLDAAGTTSALWFF
jgi:hypothetical protein